MKKQTDALRAQAPRHAFLTIFGLAVMLALLLFGMAPAQNAWAADADESSAEATAEAVSTEAVESADTANNTFASGSQSTLSGSYERDLYWVGNNLHLSNAEIAGDAILAGRTLDIANAYVNGDLRAASQDLAVGEAVIGGNITAAGQTLSFSDECRAAGVYIAGQDIVFDGQCSALAIGGNTVTLSGTINGDAKIDADHIIVTDDAVVTGTLTLRSSEQPAIASGASVADLDVQISANDDSVATSSSRSVGSYIVGFIYWAVAFIIICLLIAWLAPKAPKDSIDMIRNRTGAFILTGIIAIIALPVAAILLLLFLVTAPIAVILLAAAVIVGILGLPFLMTAIFSRIFSSMSTVIAGLIGAVVAALLLQVPGLNVILVTLGAAYLAAYLLQKVYLDLHQRAEAKHAAAMAEAQQMWGQAPMPGSVPAAQPAPQQPAISQAQTVQAPVASQAPAAPQAPVAPAAPQAPSAPQPPEVPDAPKPPEA